MIEHIMTTILTLLLDLRLTMAVGLVVGNTIIDLNMCILKKGKIELLCYDGLSRSCGVST